MTDNSVTHGNAINVVMNCQCQHGDCVNEQTNILGSNKFQGTLMLDCRECVMVLV